MGCWWPSKISFSCGSEPSCSIIWQSLSSCSLKAWECTGLLLVPIHLFQLVINYFVSRQTKSRPAFIQVCDGFSNTTIQYNSPSQPHHLARDHRQGKDPVHRTEPDRLLGHAEDHRS